MHSSTAVPSCAISGGRYSMSPGASVASSVGSKRRRILSGSVGSKRQVGLPSIAPAPPAGALQQEHVVRVDVRSDAAARRGVADHHVVEPRVRNEREAAQQRIRRVAVQVHPLHEQREVAARKPGESRAAERAMLERIAAPNLAHEPRRDVVARSECEELVARGDTGEPGHRAADDERRLVPVTGDESGRREAAEQITGSAFPHRASIATRCPTPGGTMPARAHPPARAPRAHLHIDSDMNVFANTVVTLSFKLYDSNNQLIEETDEPIAYLHGGHSGIFPKVEAALNAKKVGDTVSVTLEPDDAFGDYDAELMRIEALDQLPPDVAVGGHLIAEQDGNEVVWRITGIADGKAVLDGNHELAGQRLRFDCKVLDIRPATQDEMTHGHVHGAHGHHH